MTETRETESPDDSRPVIEAQQFLDLIHATIPLARQFELSLELPERGVAKLRMVADASMIRAGGTVSGPTLMTLADTALYAAILSAIGLEPMAVTSNLNVSFLRRPQPGPLLAEARLLKLGRSLAYGCVDMRSEGELALVAHATGTYALPGARQARPQ